MELFEGFSVTRDIPLWGAFIVLLGIFARQIVPWRQLSLSSEQQIRKELHDRIADLKKEHGEVTNRLIACEKECARHKSDMEEKILGMQRQHLAEQLTLVRTVIDVFPEAPQLRLLLRALETGQRSVTYVEGVAGDREKTNGK